MEQQITKILKDFGVNINKIFLTNTRKFNWNIYTNRVDIESNSRTIELMVSTKMILKNHFTDDFVQYINGSNGIILYNDIDYIENGDTKVMVLSYVFVPPFVDGVSQIYTHDNIHWLNRFTEDFYKVNKIKKMTQEENYQIHVIVSDKKSIETITLEQLKYANTLKVYDGDDINYDTIYQFDLVLVDKNLTGVIEKFKELNFHVFEQDNLVKLSENEINSLEDFLNTIVFDSKLVKPVRVNNYIDELFGNIENQIFEKMLPITSLVRNLRTNPNFDKVIDKYVGIKSIHELSFC